MKTEICKACGKRIVLECASFSEVRRANFFMQFCLCPENNTPADLKILVQALSDARKEREENKWP